MRGKITIRHKLVGLVGLFLAPITLLVGLLVAQSSKDIAFADAVAGETNAATTALLGVADQLTGRTTVLKRELTGFVEKIQAAG
jgi:hypothetical protein